MEQGIDPEEKKAYSQAIKDTKDSLKQLIDQNCGLTRVVRSEALKMTNAVQVFESNLTRSLQMTPDAINDAMVIVRVYYFGVAESIIKNGFYMNGEHYVFFSASAGQIRTKKFVAIQENKLNACMNQLTCGLSVENINAQGGININKYLAYLALCNSATEVWKDFNIDRCIVIDDFETMVHGLVDFIDEKTYETTRMEMDVPITHTDGCGMILPTVCSKNFMVRAPWVKGLLSPFPFDRYIREANERDKSRNHAIITDVYGQEHNILTEHIQVIFTKSQFKLWKMYPDWDTYKRNFKKYGCTAGRCNVEPGFINRATINYQMLQTLTSMTDEELADICSTTNRALSKISCDRTTMLKILGATPSNPFKGPFQECLLLYPELLQDDHCKNVLREMKRAMEVDARAGKLMIDGKYQFLIPDLYAACQYWFDGIEVPEGLLADNEVWTKQYPKASKLDVLRSPHLYKEHAVRPNVYDTKTHLKKWFATNGIYTSTHDMISKILQFDNDGDKALVVAEPTIISVAERECSDVVPLYYPMAKAGASEVTPEAMYNGMVAAWSGGNIGEISNSISKIWGSNNPDVDAVKVFCMENNFVIDYAKTLYKPTRPKEWEERLKEQTRGKVPSFFQYAKGKTESQVSARGNGVVDRLYNQVQMYKFDFNIKSHGALDYRMLMYNENIPYGEKERKLVQEFRKASASMGTSAGVHDENSRYWLQLKELKQKIMAYGSRQYVVDVLVRGLFHEHHVRKKSAFWDCFGDVVLENLKNNLPDKTKCCPKCGKRFRLERNEKYCKECRVSEPTTTISDAVCVVCGSTFKTSDTTSGAICPACKMSFGGRRTVKKKCVECGVEFDMVAIGRSSSRCSQCQKERNRQKVKAWKINRK